MEKSPGVNSISAEIIKLRGEINRRQFYKGKNRNKKSNSINNTRNRIEVDKETYIVFVGMEKMLTM